MGNNINVGDLADTIMEGLTQYAELATEDMKAAVRKAGKTVRKEIQQNAPKQTGAYGKSWSVKNVNLGGRRIIRSEEHTSELQSHSDLVCRLLLEIGRASCRERV